jgi:hypothetical protein
MADDEAPLQQIFGGNTARIIDHLITFRDFDYSLKEISDILKIKELFVESILEFLINYELVQMTSKDNITKYKIAKNEMTDLLNRFVFSVASKNIERLTGKKL